MNELGRSADTLSALQSLGFTLPSPAYLLGAFVFGLIGFAAYRIGKSREAPWTRWLGVTLMFYPYAVSNTQLMYTVGAALCLALYYTRSM